METGRSIEASVSFYGAIRRNSFFLPDAFFAFTSTNDSPVFEGKWGLTPPSTPT
jgi:hypothetical protein